jgi:hypothetical protein
LQSLKNILKFIWKHKRPQIGKSNLEEKQQFWRNHNTQPKIKLWTHNNKNSILLAKTRYVDQRHMIEYWEINPCSYNHLILTRVPKTYIEERTVYFLNLSLLA